VSSRTSQNLTSRGADDGEQLELGQRPNVLARRPAPVVEPETTALPFTLSPYTRCPRCRCAAEDGRKVRHPFRGIACFHCGARIRFGDFPEGVWGEVVLVNG
jgi:hypothetical protein